MKHTPGPWKLYRPPDEPAWVGTLDGEPITDVLDDNNGALIAAAPRLAVALKRCAKFLATIQYGTRDDDEVLVEARAALREAGIEP